MNLDLLNQQAAANARFSAEVVYVEWNPVESGPTSAALLGAYARRAARLGAANASTRVRVVTVPKEVHGALKDVFLRAGASPKVNWPPVIEYFGKNVGVRRARGEFVMTTNPDDVFHRQLVASLGRARLMATNYYRAARLHCKAWGKMTARRGDDRHAFAEQCGGAVKTPPFWDARPRASRNSCRSGGVDAALATRADASKDPSVAGVKPFAYASGDFWLMRRDLWHAVGGYVEAGVTTALRSKMTIGREAGVTMALRSKMMMLATWGCDGFSLCRALGGAKVPQVTLDEKCVTIHLDHDKKTSNANVGRADDAPNVTAPPFDNVTFARVVAAWARTDRGPRKKTGATAADVAAASATFTRAWADDVNTRDPNDPDWSHAGCVQMGTRRVRKERLYDTLSDAHAPALFGWPELTLPAVVVWPPGLREDDLGRC